jgi:hypothetical protein
MGALDLGEVLSQWGCTLKERKRLILVEGYHEITSEI